MWILSKYMKSNKPRKSFLSFVLQHQCASIPFNPFSFYLFIYCKEPWNLFYITPLAWGCELLAGHSHNLKMKSRKWCWKGSRRFCRKTWYLNSTAKRIHTVLQCSFRSSTPEFIDINCEASTLTSTPSRPSLCPVKYNTCCWLVRISLCGSVIFFCFSLLTKLYMGCVCTQLADCKEITYIE